MFTQINFEKFLINKDDLKFLIIIISIVIFNLLFLGAISETILEKIYNPQPIYKEYETFNKIKTIYEIQSKIVEVKINKDVYRLLVIENRKNEKENIKNLPSLESLLKDNNLKQNNVLGNLPKLRAIFISDLIKFAILDNVTVKEKDTYKNFKVIKIEQDKILLENINLGEKVWLNLFK